MGVLGRDHLSGLLVTEGREQVGHKCSNLAPLPLPSSSGAPLAAPRWTPEDTGTALSHGLEEDGEKRHYIQNVGKQAMTHRPLYDHSEPHRTDAETEVLQDRAACPHLHNGAGILLRQVRTPSLFSLSK